MKLAILIFTLLNLVLVIKVIFNQIKINRQDKELDKIRREIEEATNEAELMVAKYQNRII